jgi:transcriptional regulator with XRE-family HTH domain
MPPQRKKPGRIIRRTDRNDVGPVIARIRNQLGLSQEDLAGRTAAIGWVVSRDMIKKVERREREVTDIELKRFARALRIPAALLLEE